MLFYGPLGRCPWNDVRHGKETTSEILYSSTKTTECVPSIFYSTSLVFIYRVFIQPYSRPLLPLEVIGEIFITSMDHDEPYDANLILQTRDAIRSVHTYFWELVRKHPAFWSHVLVTSATSRESFEKALEHISLPGFILTFRCVDMNPFTHDGTAEMWNRVQNFATEMSNVASPYMSWCRQLNYQMSDAVTLDFFLQRAEWFDADMISSVSVSFAAGAYTFFRPGRLMAFHFRRHTNNSTKFYGFTSLALVANGISTPVFNYVSTPDVSLTVHQSPMMQFQWDEVVMLLEASQHLEVLRMEGIDFHIDVYALLMAPALNRLHTLDVRFDGDRSMAFIVSRLNLPCLKTVKIWLASGDDVECVVLCSNLFRDVPHVVLSGPCPILINMDRLFMVFHNVNRLDIRGASMPVYTAFRLASNRQINNGGVNYHACPDLQELLVRNVPPESVRDLLIRREACGYKSMRSIYLGSAGIMSQDVSDYFVAKGVEITMAF